MTKTQQNNEEFVELGIAQYVQVLKRRWLPAGLTVLICTALSAVIAIQNNRPLYESKGKLLFLSGDPKSQLAGVDPEVGQLKFETVGRNNPIENQANLLVSGSLLEAVIKTLDLRNSLGEYIPFDSVRRDLTVQQIPNTDILEISYTSSNPADSADFVNVLMKSYLQFNEKNQRYNIEAARSFIKGQLPKLKVEFEAASAKLKDFKSRNSVVSLDSKALEVSNLSAQTLENERDALRRLETASAKTEALRRQVDQLTRISGLSLNELSQLSDATLIQETLAEIQAVQSELEVQKQNYTFDHPTVMDLGLKLDSLKEVLQAQTTSLLGRPVPVNPKSLQLSELQKQLISELAQSEIELQGLREDVQILSEQKNVLGQRIVDFANLEKIQQDLEQDLNSARQRYFQLLESLERLDLAEIKIRESNQVQIIEGAVRPEIPVNSFNLKIVMAGALLGMSLAFGLALLLDILDSKIKTLEQLEKASPYPIIGAIPNHESMLDGEDTLDFDVLESANPRTNRVITLGENFASTHIAYQQIYLNLTLLQHEKIPQTISITSSSDREGKSEISANIAAMLAQSGYQVLLVDASLRTPSQHKLWKLENNVGLSDVLSDSVNASLVRQKVAPNLHVITAGRAIAHMSIISRYSEALSFIDQVSKQYDCVVFDTESICDEPDAISLSRACEGTILVACIKQLQISEFQNAKALLAQARIPILGLIANQVTNSDVKKFRFFNPLQSVVKRETVDISSDVTADIAEERLDIVNS